MRIPDTIFYTRVRDDALDDVNPFRWEIINTSKDVFAGKKVVVFSLPGAFTPTCSSSHLPGFEKKYAEVIATGVDEIYCVSVNDAFVMYQWGKYQGIKNIKLLPDGNGDFTRLMGMLVKKENLGFGDRSWRYSMVVDDGNVEKMFVEEGLGDNFDDDPFEVSDVDTMLTYLKS